MNTEETTERGEQVGTSDFNSEGLQMDSCYSRKQDHISCHMGFATVCRAALTQWSGEREQREISEKCCFLIGRSRSSQAGNTHE